MKKSKQAYNDKFFNTWKGIKSLISLKTVPSREVPTVQSLDNGDTITIPHDIANTFNNYFASILRKKSIKYSHKHFPDYLANENGNTIFLKTTDKQRIANIISSLTSDKASDPCSIPCCFLKMKFRSNWWRHSTSPS